MKPIIFTIKTIFPRHIKNPKTVSKHQRQLHTPRHLSSSSSKTKSNTIIKLYHDHKPKPMMQFSRSVSRANKLGSFLRVCQRRFIRVSTCEENEMGSSNVAEGVKDRKIVALWGNGDYGRLGLGNLESKWRPAFVSGLWDGCLKDVACGGAHTLFLTDNGSVYAAGLNDHGQLGVPDGIEYTIDPLEVSGLPKDIVKISAGYYHSSAITESGELYMWGKNSSGQLGLGRKVAKVIPVPSKVEFLNGVPIKMAALGSDHSIAVTETGEVLSWGGGESGRLGHGHKSSLLGFLSSSSEYTPRLIKELEDVKVRSIAAGMLHSACIDENGSVYVFGEKTVKKLVSREGSTVSTPSKIGELPFSEEVACGAHHTCVITRGGELYTWGSNENGCLGTGDTHTVYVPERVGGPFQRHPVCKVSCGWKHTAAISDGNVYTWGWGGAMGTFFEEEHSSGGQLGLGDDVDYVEPTKVNFGENVKAVQISCGFNHTGAVLEYN